MGYERPRMDATYTTTKSKHDPPPRGYSPFRHRFRFVDWAKQGKVQNAWDELTLKHALTSSKLQDIDIDRVFGLLDVSLIGTP